MFESQIFLSKNEIREEVFGSSGWHSGCSCGIPRFKLVARTDNIVFLKASYILPSAHGHNVGCNQKTLF